MFVAVLSYVLVTVKSSDSVGKLFIRKSQGTRVRDFSKGAFLPVCMEGDPEGTEWVQTRHLLLLPLLLHFLS